MSKDNTLAFEKEVEGLLYPLEESIALHMEKTGSSISARYYLDKKIQAIVKAYQSLIAEEKIKAFDEGVGKGWRDCEEANQINLAAERRKAMWEVLQKLAKDNNRDSFLNLLAELEQED